MIEQGVLAGLAKVIAVGALTVAAAGGIYLVASTQADDEDSAAQIADGALTVEAEATSTTTPTAEPDSPTVAPTAEVVIFPTPSSDSDTMVIGGWPWVDARPFFGEVVALVGDLECGSSQSGALPDGSSIPIFVIEIASNAQQAGCGVPGAPMTIMLGARAANEMIQWNAGFQQQVTLIAGPSFAQYSGTVRVSAGAFPTVQVVPYVGDLVCGAQIDGGFSGLSEWYYQVVVDPVQLKPGCGQDGAEVVLKLVEGSGDRTLAVVPWQPGPLVRLPVFDLTTVPASTPAVSTEAHP